MGVFYITTNNGGFWTVRHAELQSVSLASLPSNRLETYNEMLDLNETLSTLMDISIYPIVIRKVVSYGGKAFLAKNFDEMYIAIGETELDTIDCRRTQLMIHELLHIKTWIDHINTGGTPVNGRFRGHNIKFKTLERKFMGYFGMIPIYDRIYIHTIMDTEDNVLWTRKK